MFVNLEKELKAIQAKSLEQQEITQKYLVTDSGDRMMNDAFKQIQQKKKKSQYFCKQCNKKFLSFPALKAHSEKQHGFQPQQDGKQRKRGRPRRDVVKPSDQYHKWEQEQITQPDKPKRPTSLITFPISETMKEFQIIERKGYKEGIVILQEILRDQLEESDIRKTLEEFHNNESQLQEFYLKKNLPVNYLLTGFLVNAAQFAQRDFLEVLIIFVKAIYYYIDEYARKDLLVYLSLEEHGLVPQVIKNKKFHEQMTIRTFPMILNYFIEFLPSMLPDFPTVYASRLLKDISDWCHKECGGMEVNFN